MSDGQRRDLYCQQLSRMTEICYAQICAKLKLCLCNFMLIAETLLIRIYFQVTNVSIVDTSFN